MAQKENKVERKRRGRPGKTIEELKEDLKKEIIRLGMENFPSMTEYRKKYARGKAPSASGIMNKTGQNWGELMVELGFEYNQVRSKYSAVYTEAGKKEMLNKIVSLMKKENLTQYKEICENILPKLGITYSVLIKSGIDWWRISNAYEEKYGKIEGRRNTYQSKGWLDKIAADRLLKELFELLDKNNATSLEEVKYMTKKYAEKRFGTSDLYKLEKIYEIIKK